MSNARAWQFLRDGLNLGLKHVLWHRGTKQQALVGQAAVLRKDLLLRLGFDTFSDHLQAERARHGNDGPHDGQIAGVGGGE